MSAPPSINGLGHLGGVPDRQFESDVRIGVGERRHPRGKPVVGDGLAGGQGDGAPFEAGQVVQRPRRGVGSSQHRSGFGEEYPARFGQGESAADPVEQAHAMPRLQGRDGGAHRRLGDVQRPRGAGHMQPLRHGDIHAKLLKGHRHQSEISIEANLTMRWTD